MVLQPEDHQRSGQLKRLKMLDPMNVPIGPLVFDHATTTPTGTCSAYTSGRARQAEGEETLKATSFRSPRALQCCAPFDFGTRGLFALLSGGIG